MAVSGSFDYTCTGLNVITAALEDIQVVQSGETIGNDDQATALRTLNYMVKEWMGKPTFAPGLKRWTRKWFYLFLRLNKNIYTLAQAGVTGDDIACVDSYAHTTLSANAAAGQPVIATQAVTAYYNWPTGVAGSYTSVNSDPIGVQLDGGDIQWSTIKTGGGTAAVTLNDNLTGTAASGNVVFTFPLLNLADLPLDFLTLVRRDLNGIDYPMDKMQDVYEYEQISNKNITATPITWFYQKQRVIGQMLLSCFPSTKTDVLRGVALYPIDDEDTTADTMAFPQQWYGALEWGLAKKLAPKFGKEWSQTMQGNYDEAMASAAAVDPEVVPQYFQPGRDDFGANYAGGR